MRASTLRCLLAIGLIQCLPGCNTKAEKKAEPASAAKSGELTTEQKAIAKLPESEQAAATAQKVCVLSGEKLGSMGKPFKVTLKGRDVYLCCEGCKADVLADPDKFLAKLDHPGEADKPADTATDGAKSPSETPASEGTGDSPATTKE